MSFFENTRKPVGLGGKTYVAMMNLGHSPCGAVGTSISTTCAKCQGAGLRLRRRGEHELLKNAPHGVVKGVDLFALSVEKTRKLNPNCNSGGALRRSAKAVADMKVFEDSYLMPPRPLRLLYFGPDLPRCFREVWRTLKPGRTILICNESNGDTDKDEGGRRSSAA